MMVLLIGSNFMPVDHEKSLSALELSSFNVSTPSISFNKETKDRINTAVDNESVLLIG